MTPNLIAMVEVGGLGMIRNLWFKKKNLQDPRRATLLISDYHGIIWAWVGINVTAKTKGQVPIKAEEILSSGYKLEGETLGLNCRQIITIDEYSMRSMNNQETQQQYDQLMATIDSLDMGPHGVSNYLMEIKGGGAQASASAPTSSTGRDPRNDSLVGIMLICLLEVYPESFVSRKSDGTVQVEAASGETISYNYINFQLQMQPNSKPIPNSALERFKDLTKPS